MTFPRAAQTLLPSGMSLHVGAATPLTDGASRGSGAFHSAAAFVDTWIAAPRRIAPQPRPDYGPKYNGVGECPF